MDRRNFFKILSTASAGVISTACGDKTDKLIPLLVPEHQIPQGAELWKPAVCGECGAGCGTLVRIMEGERVIERNGEQWRERIAAVKKVEGNPLDPVSGGHLCARGQATVQSLYHPDRLRGPMKRTGDRGKAQFAPVSWDEAIAAAADALGKARSAGPAGIVFLTGPQAGMRSLAIEKFMTVLGAPAPVVCSVADHPVERKAAELVFGWKGLPVYDLANAHHALGVGADFLGGWASPVYYSRQYGNFRQGRGHIRGHLAHAESRMSLTASSADRWLPLRPGTEPQFLAAVARILLDGRPGANRDKLPKPVLDAFQSADVALQLKICGLEEKRVRPVVEELAQSDAPLLIGGASTTHRNSLDAVIASHYINVLLGNIGKPGGVLAPAPEAVPPIANHRATDALAKAAVILVDGANPLYTEPRASSAQVWFSRAQFVVSFASFIDDTAAWSDTILPASHPFEAPTAVAASVSRQIAVAVGSPFIKPLYDTRPVEQTLADLAGKLEAAYQRVTPRDVIQPLLAPEAAFDDIAREGGLWIDPPPTPESTPVREAKPGGAAAYDPAPAEFHGDAAQFPLYFQPYLSTQFHDGSASHLPWLQELPDPASSAIWGLPIEIDPKTAANLRVANGDIVRVESPHGSFEAPAYVHPGAVPQVVSMAIGDGHQHFTRYASGRGANPLSILAPVYESNTGALVLGATRVKLTRVGDRRDWIQFSTEERHEREIGHR